MPYNQFTMPQVQENFGVSLTTIAELFPNVNPHPVNAILRSRLKLYSSFAISEVARSHFLIAPLLAELMSLADYRLAMFAGSRFDVDETVGLNGICDFIIGEPPQLNYVKAPVMMIVEAKNEDIWGGIGQCAATMIAGQRFNSTRTPPKQSPVYGAVTDGERWRFLKLIDTIVELEAADRAYSDPDQILGILLHITGITPAAPVAA